MPRWLQVSCETSSCMSQKVSRAIGLTDEVMWMPVCLLTCLCNISNVQAVAQALHCIGILHALSSGGTARCCCCCCQIHVSAQQKALRQLVGIQVCCSKMIGCTGIPFMQMKLWHKGVHVCFGQESCWRGHSSQCFHMRWTWHPLHGVLSPECHEALILLTRMRASVHSSDTTRSSTQI